MTKFEVAEEQLFHAVQLYLDGTYLISAITLSGAAEEILGRLIENNNMKNALNEKVDELSQLCEAIFDEPADRERIMKLKNRAKNELKHNRKGNPIDMDLEQEAVNMLDRALSNYRRLNPGPLDEYRDFQKERVKRWRERCGANA